MEQPRTHYQVSFTSKQALSVFVGLLVALGLAYFFGLMTGLAGREPEEGDSGKLVESVAGMPATTPPAGPAREGAEAGGDLTFPVPVTAAPSAGGPPPPAVVRPFEDREGPPTALVTTRPAAATAAVGFRVQVLSVSSRKEADAEAARLTRIGLPARVEAGAGPKGTVYRVRVGPYRTREEAARATQRLAAEGRRDTWIVPPGQ